MIKVIFRKDKKTGQIIAFLPSLAGDRFWLMTCESYATVGQHGSASFNYYYEATKPATPEEYGDLLEEMQSIYDNELIIGHRMTVADTRARRKQVQEGSKS